MLDAFSWLSFDWTLIPAEAVKLVWAWADPGRLLEFSLMMLQLAALWISWIAPSEVSTALASVSAWLGSVPLLDAYAVGLWFIDPFVSATLVVAAFKVCALTWFVCMFTLLVIWCIDQIRKILGFVPFAGMGGGGS